MKALRVVSVAVSLTVVVGALAAPALADPPWTCTIDELPGVVAKVTISPPT